MSRAMNIKLTRDEVSQKCKSAGVSISAIELLSSGFTHLVCTTGDGAVEMRQRLKKYIIEGPQKRFPLSIAPSRW